MLPLKVLKIPATSLLENLILYLSVMVQFCAKVKANRAVRPSPVAIKRNQFFFIIKILFFSEFGAGYQLHIIGQHGGRHTGCNTEIGTFNNTGDVPTSDCFFALRMLCSTVESCIECNWFGNTVQGQVA